jgi:hypothetical protein
VFEGMFLRGRHGSGAAERGNGASAEVTKHIESLLLFVLFFPVLLLLRLSIGAGRFALAGASWPRVLRGEDRVVMFYFIQG